MKFIQDESPEKLRGGYYTQPEIAAYLARWVMEMSPSHILEPSCGDGAFIRELSRLTENGRQVRLSAFEIVGEEAVKARAQLNAAALVGDVSTEDFLAWSVRRQNDGPLFDAVVGNPPYIRYQYLSAQAQEQAERIIRGQSLRFTKHTNAWVPFVVAALSKLRPGGRLAMVIPAELLSVIHAASVRTLLLRECSQVLVVDPEELWFEETLQGVVLLLAEKRSTGTMVASRGRLGIARVRGHAFLKESVAALIARTTFVDSDEIAHKWTHALLTQAERDVMRSIASNPAVHQFSDVATVAVGIVTGANKFFLVPDEVVDEFDLSEFAYPMFGRSEHVAGVIYDGDSHQHNRDHGHPSNFIWFDPIKRLILPHGARRYIAMGEAEALDKRFKCRIRSPWYAVPSVFASPVGMLKRSHEFPRLVLNDLKAFTTDTAYRIAPKGVSATSLVASFVNSLTALSAELEGRHYGGGVLELVPSEINRLVVPIADLDRSDLIRLDSAFRNGIGTQEIFEIQDDLVLRSIGLTSSQMADVQGAAWRLRNRRLRSPAPEAEMDEAGLDDSRARTTETVLAE